MPSWFKVVAQWKDSVDSKFQCFVMFWRKLQSSFMDKMRLFTLQLRLQSFYYWYDRIITAFRVFDLVEVFLLFFKKNHWLLQAKLTPCALEFLSHLCRCLAHAVWLRPVQGTEGWALHTLGTRDSHWSTECWIQPSTANICQHTDGYTARTFPQTFVRYF